MLYRSPYPELPSPPDKNVHELFFNRPEQLSWGNHTIHVDPVTGHRRGYQEFLVYLQDAATALAAPKLQGGLGLRSEDADIVGIMSENSMDYITLVHACLKIATPFSLISSYSTSFEFKHALTLSKATCLFIQSKNLPVVLPIAKETGFPLDKIFILGGNAKGYQAFSDLIEEVKRKGLAPVPVKPAKKSTLAYLIFSSGTSGLPKAVMISHGNVYFSITQHILIQKCIAEVHKVNTLPPCDPWTSYTDTYWHLNQAPPPQSPEGLPVSLAFLPFHHSYGLQVFCFRSFLIPSTLIILSKWDTELALKFIPRYKVSTLHLIPSVVHQLVNYSKIKNADFSSIVSTNCGAAYLPLDLQRRMESILPKDANFSQGYGMSEATIGTITQPFPGILGGRLKRIPGCLGVLIPGMEGRVVREDGSDVDVHEIGELIVRGENVALGYWNNEKATKETFVNGWLRSGDHVKADRDGNFYYADRSKDTLKISGAQVSPLEIEAVLIAHPKGLISDVTVAGVTGGRTSDEKVPRAWIVLSDHGKKLGAAAVVRELESWHQENLSKYKWLRGGIEIVRAIPKSPTGKTLRRVLQQKYEQRLVKARL